MICLKPWGAFELAKGIGCMKIVKKSLIQTRHWLKRFVNKKIPTNSIEFSWHYGFIGTHMLAAIAALVSFLAYVLAYDGWPDYVILGGVGLLILPMAIAAHLSYSGSIKQAQFLSSTNLVLLTGYGAVFTGGVSSFLVPWFAIAPFEAALSGSRRVVIWALLISCLAVAGLFGLDYMAMLPLSRVATLNLDLLNILGISSAAIYAGSLALMIHKFNMLSKSALMKGERRYRLLAENATDMITRHSPEGAVMFISGSAQGLFGCEAELLLGDGLAAHIHPDDRANYYQSISLASQTKETIAVEFRIGSFDEKFTNDGPQALLDEQWVEMRCRPLTRSNDRLTLLQASEIVAVTRDVTQRKRQQVELKQARDDAERASLAKTHFLASMSHELRTPLNAIIGFSEVLQAQAGNTKQEAAEQEYIGLIHSSGIHLLNVVNSLLDMSKIEFGKMQLDMQPIDLANVVSSCMALMQTMAQEADVRISCSSSEDTISLVADQQACKQIVLNLLSNAVKFSKPGGQVTITLARKGVFAELIVEDQGIGIPDDILPRLTEPFAQVENTYDRATEGTGLGLSIVNGLVELHGGTLTLESKLGMGTHAIVQLPLVARQTKPDEEKIEKQSTLLPAGKMDHTQNAKQIIS